MYFGGLPLRHFVAHAPIGAPRGRRSRRVALLPWPCGLFSGLYFAQSGPLYFRSRAHRRSAHLISKLRLGWRRWRRVALLPSPSGRNTKSLLGTLRVAIYAPKGMSRWRLAFQCLAQHFQFEPLFFRRCQFGLRSGQIGGCRREGARVLRVQGRVGELGL